MWVKGGDSLQSFSGETLFCFFNSSTIQFGWDFWRERDLKANVLICLKYEYLVRLGPNYDKHLFFKEYIMFCKKGILHRIINYITGEASVTV